MWRVVCVFVLGLMMSACAHQQPQTQDLKQGYYTVQKDETIYSIAFALEMDPELLKRANPWLNPVNIAPGMQLSIPRRLPRDDYADYDSDPMEVPVTRSRYIWPVTRIDISSPYGKRRGRLHAGIDLRAPRGTFIYASADGEVTFSGHYRGYGHLIVIDHGDGIETAYAHNHRNMAKKGQRVKQGQIIATVGRTGHATGNHVHFEFRKHGKAVNPIRHLEAAL